MFHAVTVINTFIVLSITTHLVCTNVIKQGITNEHITKATQVVDESKYGSNKPEMTEQDHPNAFLFNSRSQNQNSENGYISAIETVLDGQLEVKKDDKHMSTTSHGKQSLKSKDKIQTFHLNTVKEVQKEKRTFRGLHIHPKEGPTVLTNVRQEKKLHKTKSNILLHSLKSFTSRMVNNKEVRIQPRVLIHCMDQDCVNQMNSFLEHLKSPFYVTVAGAHMWG